MGRLRLGLGARLNWCSRLLFAAALTLTASLSPAHAQRIITISTENRAEHVQTIAVAAFAVRLQEALGDRYEVNHHSGGALFRDRDVIEAMSQGQVDIAVPGTWQLDRFAPSVGVYMLPSLYGRTLEEINSLRDSSLGDIISTDIETKTDTIVFGRWIDLGFAHLFTAGNRPSDYESRQGVVVRSPGGQANIERLTALGFEPVTIPWGDLPQALESGDVDMVLTTYESAASVNLWDVGIRGVIEDRQYFAQYVPMVSRRLWARLNNQEQSAFEEAWEVGVELARADAVSRQDRAKQTAAQNGVQILEQTQDDIEATRTALRQIEDDIVAQLAISAQLVNAVRARLDE